MNKMSMLNTKLDRIIYKQTTSYSSHSCKADTPEIKVFHDPTNGIYPKPTESPSHPNSY